MHLDFTLAGAKLDAQARTRAAAIVERLAALFTTFRQNVLHDEATRGLELRDERDLAGVPAAVRATAREAARERGMDRGWFVSMSRSIVVPFLTYAERRDLRERAFRLWTSRGEHAGEHDNRPVAREILALRQELARLHGHASYADYALVDRMAGTPAAAAALLERAWVPARARALEERDELAALARSRGEPDTIEPWDWRYYAEKLREARYALDEEALKPYFPLERMMEAAFDCAQRLFGITFVPRPDLEAYHPDVRTYEVRGADGRTVALFLVGQLHARDQARRRVDVELPHAVARRGRGAADRRQQQQLRQGAAGRADAAVAGRRAHAVPRVRARPARACCRRSPGSACRARTCSPTSSSFRRRSSSTGPSSPRC